MTILESSFLWEVRKIIQHMYNHGWDERNGGNLSYLLSSDEVDHYLLNSSVIRTIPIGFDATALIGKVFVVTGTGKYFKNVYDDPENNLGIIRIDETGSCAEVLWGFKDGGKFTSELPSHLMSHISRLKVDPFHRVVMHCHPSNVLAMTFVHSLDEREFTRTLWKMCTECIVVFPEGVSILPWMLCGTNSIGEATALKMEESRIVIWAQHGIYGVGRTMDETFGLIETVEKAAEIYIKIMNSEIKNTISDEQLRELAEYFKVDYRKEYLG